MNNSEDEHFDPGSMAYAPMDLPTYRQMVSHLPVPSNSQVEAFVGFVSHAHSWYKHMQLTPPRSTLQFFLDPHAGMQRVGHADGSVSVETRTERGFHYSWIATQEYRQRFGYLAFSRSQGTSVSMRSVDGHWLVPTDDDPVVLNIKSGALHLLPAEVLEAGGAKVSGLIHTLGAHSDYWAHYLLRGRALPFWPEESGGASTMEQMRQRCEELKANPELKERKPINDYRNEHEVDLSMIDYRLYQLVEPERNRQLAGMKDAIQRVVALLAAP